MLGRGLLANPGLTRHIKNNTKIEKELLKEFHDRLYNDYKKILFGDMNVLYKMKGIWFYMISMFSDNEKYIKRIRKAVRLYDYDEAISSLFREQYILEDYEENLVFKV
jgi:tRNA-dihydrouridine synthase